MMLCGQQLVKSTVQGLDEWVSRVIWQDFSRKFLYLWTLGNAIFIVICYLLILHHFCTVCVYDVNLLIRIACFVLRRLRFNDAIVRSLVQEVDRLNCL